MRQLLYILDADGEPVPCEHAEVWGDWFQTHDRHVGDDTVGESRISTVFLGMDHRFMGDGPPILWETLVMGGPLDGEGARYASRADALRGHVEFVARAMAAHEYESST